MTKYLLNAACLSLLALVAIACGDPNLEDPNVDEFADEFVDEELVDEEIVDEEVEEELIAPFDNDSAANPAVDEFLSITNTREIVYTDQISAEDGDNEDFVQFELPNASNPNQNMGISIDCDVFNGVAMSASFTLTARGVGGALIASDTKIASGFGTANFLQHLSVSAPGIRSFEVTTNLPTGYTYAIDTLVFNVEGSIGTSRCVSTTNSSGSAALLTATGSTSVVANSLVIQAEPLPASTLRRASTSCSSNGLTR